MEKNKNKNRLTNTTASLRRRQLTGSHTVCGMYINYRGAGGPAAAPRCALRPRRTPRPHVHTHRQPGARRASPVRVLLYVIIRGGTIKEAGVEGLPLLPPGEDARDGAESHLLFLLFPFLVFKIL